MLTRRAQTKHQILFWLWTGGPADQRTSSSFLKSTCVLSLRLHELVTSPVITSFGKWLKEWDGNDELLLQESAVVAPGFPGQNQNSLKGLYVWSDLGTLGLLQTPEHFNQPASLFIQFMKLNPWRFWVLSLCFLSSPLLQWWVPFFAFKVWTNEYYKYEETSPSSSCFSS